MRRDWLKLPRRDPDRSRRSWSPLRRSRAQESPDTPPEEPRTVESPSIQELLRSAPPTRRDAPLTDVCLHESEWEGGRLLLGCRRPATSNRLLCGRHAAQHDRVKRDRARKKRARAQRQRSRR